MNETKFKPGDKVRVKSSTLKYIRCTDIGKSYTTHPKAFLYGCVNYDKNKNLTKGRVYKVIKYVEINEGEFGYSCSYGDKDYLIGEKGVTASTKKAYDAQFKPVIPEYVECIYNNGTLKGKLTVGKIYKIKKVTHYTSSGEYVYIEDFPVTGIFRGLSPSAITDYNKYTGFKPSTKKAYELQNKSKEWSVGTYVVFLIEYGENPIGAISKIVKDYGTAVSVKLPLREGGPGCNLFKGTECTWFATKEEAEAFAKTLKPEITVESEMERLGLAVGDRVKVVNEPIKNAYYDGCRFDKLKGLRGQFYTIYGGIILKNTLFVQINRAGNYVLASAVTKIEPEFRLGGYLVDVSTTKVKIGCTSLDKQRVVAFLIDFTDFVRIFSGAGDNHITINDVKIDYDKAIELLKYINKH